MRSRTAFVLAAGLLAAAAVLLQPFRASASSGQDGSQARGDIAVVDILTLLEHLLQTDQYVTPRNERRDAIRAQLRPLETRLESFQQEMQLMPDGDPRAIQLQQQAQATFQQYQQRAAEASQQFDEFSAEQAADAYATLSGKAREIAERLGYRTLLASRERAAIRAKDNLATVTQEILARSVLRHPEGDDITQAVREALSIPVPEEAPELNQLEMDPAGGGEGGG